MHSYLYPLSRNNSLPNLTVPKIIEVKLIKLSISFELHLFLWDNTVFVVFSDHNRLFFMFFLSFFLLHCILRIYLWIHCKTISLIYFIWAWMHNPFCSKMTIHIIFVLQIIVCINIRLKSMIYWKLEWIIINVRKNTWHSLPLFIL